MSEDLGTIVNGYEFAYSGALSGFNSVKKSRLNGIYRIVLEGGSVSFKTRGKNINRTISERNLGALYGRVEGPLNLAQIVFSESFLQFLEDKKTEMKDTFSRYLPNLGGQHGA